METSVIVATIKLKKGGARNNGGKKKKKKSKFKCPGKSSFSCLTSELWNQSGEFCCDVALNGGRFWCLDMSILQIRRIRYLGWTHRTSPWMVFQIILLSVALPTFLLPLLTHSAFKWHTVLKYEASPALFCKNQHHSI